MTTNFIRLPQVDAGVGGAGVHRTDIEWCDYALGGLVRARDPVTKKVLNMCVPVSPGCANCYASNITRRFHPGMAGGYSAQNAARVEWFFDEVAARSLLTFRPKGPFKGGRSRATVFLGDMTDPAGEWVTDEWMDRMLALCALRPDVDFLILVKRVERMAEYLNAGREGHRVRDAAIDIIGKHDVDTTPPGRRYPMEFTRLPNEAWPLPNVWLGVSVEDQARADERIPHLLRCPAAVRFLSCEPLLGAVDLYQTCMNRAGMTGDPAYAYPASAGVDWVIVGGESGALSKIRVCNVGWIRSIVTQCRNAGVPCFVKQLGSLVSGQLDHPDNEGYGVHGVRLNDRKGGDPAEWPEDLRVREWPRVGGGA